jgi:hypothetical protein
MPMRTRPARVPPNADAQAPFNENCSRPALAEPKETRARPLPWALPALSVDRLLRAHWSGSRECPECHSGDVAKDRRHSYSCLQCGCRFNGYRIGKLRISL